MIHCLALILTGLILLYYGAEWLVAGSAGLARARGIPTLIVGLTIVAYGTSTPELVVSTLAAVEGKSAIALGNVIGSNIANIGVILGLTALIAPPTVAKELFRNDCPPLVASTLAVPVVLLDGVVSRIEGLVLLAIACAITWQTIRRAQAAPEPAEEAEGEVVPESTRHFVLRIAGGLATLVLAGKLFVDGASELARLVGVSERVIGLTIVAVGTSLPELAASVMAARRGEPEIAIGNVVGSNIFNVFLILGFAAFISPTPGTLASQLLDVAALVVFTGMIVWMLRKERELTRAEGAVLLAAYGGFTFLLLQQGA